MELFLHTIQGKVYVTLLDDKMHIIRPVHDYLNHIRLLGHSINTLRLYGISLKIFWNFLLAHKDDYKSLTPNHISEYIEYLLEPSPSKVSGYVNVEGKRSAKTINKYISILKQFLEYSAKMEAFDMEIPLLDRDTMPPFHIYKPFLYHAKSSYRTKKSYFKLKEVKYQFKILSDDECMSIENALLTTRDKLICRLLIEPPLLAKMENIIMSIYYVNKNAQLNGDHEVHTSSCSYLPTDGNRLYLGSFSNCQTAVQEAKKYFTQSNGCYYCSYPCHTS